MPHARPYYSETINEVSSIIQNIFTVASIIVNLMLLRIVHTSQRREIGAYRYLIGFYAVSDLYYTAIHWLVYPVPETYGNAFVMKGHGLINTLIGPCIYSAAYFHAFPILVSHFIYRTLLIRLPSAVREPAIFFAGMVGATAASNAYGMLMFYVLCHPDETSHSVLAPLFAGNTSSPVKHSLDTAGDYFHCLYWTGDTYSGPRWKALISAGIVAVTMVAAYATMIFCSYLIHDFLKSNATSQKTCEVHRQVFRSLIYQSIYPLVTTYFPLVVCIFLPVFGIISNWVSIVCPPSCVSHPLFNPLFLIFCIKDYRSTFLGYLRYPWCCAKEAAVEKKVTVSSTVETKLSTTNLDRKPSTSSNLDRKASVANFQVKPNVTSNY